MSTPNSKHNWFFSLSPLSPKHAQSSAITQSLISLTSVWVAHFAHGYRIWICICFCLFFNNCSSFFLYFCTHFHPPFPFPFHSYTWYVTYTKELWFWLGSAFLTQKTVPIESSFTVIWKPHVLSVPNTKENEIPLRVTWNCGGKIQHWCSSSTKILYYLTWNLILSWCGAQHYFWLSLFLFLMILMISAITSIPQVSFKKWGFLWVFWYSDTIF